MRQVWKYSFAGTGQHDITLPRGAFVLSFQIQANMFTIWVLVDTKEKDLTVRRFEIIGTGWDTEREYFEYFGTVQDDGFVWHLFEVTEEQEEWGFG